MFFITQIKMKIIQLIMVLMIRMMNVYRMKMNVIHFVARTELHAHLMMMVAHDVPVRSHAVKNNAQTIQDVQLMFVDQNLLQFAVKV